MSDDAGFFCLACALARILLGSALTSGICFGEAKNLVIRGGLVEVVNFEATTMLLQLLTCVFAHWRREGSRAPDCSSMRKKQNTPDTRPTLYTLEVVKVVDLHRCRWCHGDLDESAGERAALNHKPKKKNSLH